LFNKGEKTFLEKDFGGECGWGVVGCLSERERMIEVWRRMRTGFGLAWLVAECNPVRIGGFKCFTVPFVEVRASQTAK